MNRDLTVWLYFLLPFVALLISLVNIHTVELSTNVGLCRLCNEFITIRWVYLLCVGGE